MYKIATYIYQENNLTEKLNNWNNLLSQNSNKGALIIFSTRWYIYLSYKGKHWKGKNMFIWIQAFYTYKFKAG